MKKILLPLEETERSLKAIQYAMSHYTPQDAEFVLLMVDEKLGFSVKSEAEAEAMKALGDKLSYVAALLEGYKLTLATAAGRQDSGSPDAQKRPDAILSSCASRPKRICAIPSDRRLSMS